MFASAIDYAEHGYPIDPSLATAIARSQRNLAKYPTTAKMFLPGGRAPEAGRAVEESRPRGNTAQDRSTPSRRR